MIRLLVGFSVVLIASLALTSAPSEANEPVGAALAAVTATPTPTRTPGIPTGFAVKGNDWREVFIEGATQLGYQSVACLDEWTCWVVAEQSDYPGIRRMFRTTDGGANWEQLWDAAGYGLSERPIPTPAVVGTPVGPSARMFPDASSLRPSRFFFTDPANGFFDASFTSDAGRTWSPLKAGSASLRDFRFATSNVAYACAHELNQLFRTHDAGRSFEPWADTCAPVDAVYLSADVAWGFVDYLSNALWYTKDGWKNRSDVVIGRADEAVSAPVFYGFKRGWVAATRYRSSGSQNEYRDDLGAAIYRTVDGGVTWRRFQLHQDYLGVRELEFVSESDGWAIVASKSGLDLLRTRDGGESWAVEIRGAYSSPGFINMSHLQFHSQQLGWVNLGWWSYPACCYPLLFKHYPGIAITPTASPTATPTSPVMTPTPTRTPFAPVIPTATPGLGTPTATPRPPAVACPWVGQWAATANGEAFTMSLTSNRNQVEGTYHGDRRLSGFADGLRLNGRWAGPPSFSEPLNAGRFDFAMTADCQSFTGTWGFNASSTGGGTWSGRRVSSQERMDLTRAAYMAVLGREADATGLSYWAGTSLSKSAIEAALMASEEGQRVGAVRALYRELLLRDPLGPDNRGLRSWVDSDLTLEAIRAGMMTAPEVQRVLAIRALYRELLGRDDDLPGIRYWASSPLTLEELRTEFLNSEEYRRMHPGA